MKLKLFVVFLWLNSNLVQLKLGTGADGEKKSSVDSHYRALGELGNKMMIEQ